MCLAAAASAIRSPTCRGGEYEDSRPGSGMEGWEDRFSQEKVNGLLEAGRGESPALRLRRPFIPPLHPQFKSIQ